MKNSTISFEKYYTHDCNPQQILAVSFNNAIVMIKKIRIFLTSVYWVLDNTKIYLNECSMDTRQTDPKNYIILEIK